MKIKVVMLIAVVAAVFCTGVGVSSATQIAS